MAQKRYADEFENVISMDAKGREIKTPVYRGDYFEVNLDNQALRQYKIFNFVSIAVVLTLHVLGGLLNHQGGRLFYIAVPYAVAFFPLFYLLFAIFRLPVQKRPFRRDEIGLSFDRIKTLSLVLFILFLVILLGELILFVTNWNLISSQADYRFFLLELFAGVGMFWIFKRRQGVIINQQISES